MSDFETHLTVSASEDCDLNALADWAARNGLKFTHIMLERGDSPSQPMLTRHGVGPFEDELSAAKNLIRKLAESGYAVTRLKVEAAPWAKGVSDCVGDEDSDERGYFEHHIKLCLPPDADIMELANLALRHGAHVSRNARRARSDGTVERFVTQRCRRVGRRLASEKLMALRAELIRAGHEMLEVEEEFVVFDSNLSLDRGWIETGALPTNNSRVIDLIACAQTGG